MSPLKPVISYVDSQMTYLAGLADNSSIDYEGLVVYFSWLITSFEVYLLRRQIRCYDLTSPPAELKAHLKGDTFKKAQAYGRDKARFTLFKDVITQFFNWGLIRVGIYAKTWDMAGRVMGKVGLAPDRTIWRAWTWSWANAQITQSLIWIGILTIFSTLQSLPFSYYYTFVLEEKHGFNKSTKTLWVTDQLKSFALLAVLGGPILAAFLKVIEKAGKNFVPWLMVFMIILIFAIQLIYPTFIQPLFNKLTPLPEGDLRGRVEKLAGQLGFPLKHLYVIDGSKRSSHSNAYFYGLPWSKHIVIYDTLIDKSTPAEVEAVLAHELGHWYFSHPTKLLAIAQLHLLFIFTTFHIFIHNKSLYSSFRFSPLLANQGVRGGAQPIMIGFMLFQMVLEPLDTVVKFLMNAQTRKYEYQADEFGVELDKKGDLKSALIKLHIDNLSSPHNDELYSAYHHSHPTLPERLRAMDAYKPSGKYLKLTAKANGKGKGKKEL